VVEDLNIKRELFARVARACPADATLATNTSSLSVTLIAEAVPDPERVLGMHFFNPVHIMKLVEVVRHAKVDPKHEAKVVAVAREMGKEPIVVEDSPGFASSRLGVVLGLEAMRMVEQGVASPEDIDKALELGYGHPMGPLKVTDLVGLDVRLAVAEYLHRELGDPHYAPPAILRDKVRDGELGKKSGRGFYQWPTKQT
jgi:3-hydroxybutyryl-CoA dehydrogenase